MMHSPTCLRIRSFMVALIEVEQVGGELAPLRRREPHGPERGQEQHVAVGAWRDEYGLPWRKEHNRSIVARQHAFFAFLASSASSRYSDSLRTRSQVIMRQVTLSSPTLRSRVSPPHSGHLTPRRRSTTTSDGSYRRSFPYQRASSSPNSRANSGPARLRSARATSHAVPSATESARPPERANVADPR